MVSVKGSKSLMVSVEGSTSLMMSVDGSISLLMSVVGWLMSQEEGLMKDWFNQVFVYRSWSNHPI